MKNEIRKRFTRAGQVFTALVLLIPWPAVAAGTGWPPEDISFTPRPSTDQTFGDGIAWSDDSPQMCLQNDRPGGVGTMADDDSASFPDQRPWDTTDIPLSPTAVESPGNDTSLGLRWEAAIAVDAGDQQRVAVAQSLFLRVSIDGGDNFTAAFDVRPLLPSGYSGCGDPSLAYDSQGRLFFAYLGCLTDGSGNSRFDVFVSRHNTSTGALVSGPFNVTQQIGLPAPTFSNDKLWLAADAFAGSLFQDRLYLVWTELSGNSPGGGDWTVYSAFSSNQGQTWSMAGLGAVPGPLSAASGEGKPWPAHNTVAPNGDVYIAYHSQTGFIDPGTRRVPDGVSGQVFVLRSTDGGISYPQKNLAFQPGKADMTWNVKHLVGNIPGASYWLQGSAQPWILADPFQEGRVYVVANDDPDDSPLVDDFADVYIVRSNDSGLSWTNPSRIDSGPFDTLQVLPNAAIDPVSGSIVVSYYDNRNWFPATSQLDLYARRSGDGGNSWSVEVQINDAVFDTTVATSCRFCCPGNGCAPGSPQTMRIGEYNGVAFGQCTAHAVWTGVALPGNGDTDIFYDRDPEMGGDFDPPLIVCPDDEFLGCLDSTDPANTGEATATDTCTLEPDISFNDVVTPGNCPPSTILHTIERIWSAVDLAGNIDTCAQLITVADFDPPVIDAPEPIGLECNGPGGVPSGDPAIQAWAGLATASDECSDTQLSFNLPTVFPSGCRPNGTETNIIFSAQDACGNSDFAVSSVRVIDTTPPTIDVVSQQIVFDVANHEYVCYEDFVASADISDICDPALSIEVSCESDQCDDAPCPEHPGQDGDGDTINDCTYDAQTDILCARAERADTNLEGRTYTVTISAEDNCTNQTEELAMTIHVPWDSCEACIFGDGFESGDTAAW